MGGTDGSSSKKKKKTKGKISCAEDKWSSVPEQYEMVKCAKASLPLLLISILETDYFYASYAPAFVEGASEMEP